MLGGRAFVELLPGVNEEATSAQVPSFICSPASCKVYERRHLDHTQMTCIGMASDARNVKGLKHVTGIFPACRAT
jgi:hypothetical protein